MSALFAVRTLWTETLAHPLSAPPVFEQAFAYVPLADAHLVALDLRSGRTAWRVAADVRSPSITGAGRLFFVENTAIIALRALDGSAAWRLNLETPLTPHLAWESGRLIASTTTGAIVALRDLDGHPLWRRDIGAPLHAPPLLTAGRLYAPASDGRVVALRADTGAVLWERRLGGALNEMLALNDRLYGGSMDNFFYCLDAREGNVVWRWRTGGDVVGLPVADKGRVYFVSLDNSLRAVDRRSGNQQWRRALPLRPTRGPVLMLDAIVVSGSAPAMHAYAVKDGQPVGVIATAGAVLSKPYVLTGTNGEPPQIIIAAGDVVKGTSLSAMVRQEKDAGTPVAAVSDPVTAIPTSSGAARQR